MEIKDLSLRGRVAYGVSCFEQLLLKLDYNVQDWEYVLVELWKYTNIQYLDDWSSFISEILPDNLLEFSTYEKHCYEFLEEKNFNYLYSLYNNTDKKVDKIMTYIFNIGTSHSYSIIENYGQESLYYLELLIGFMNKYEIPLPDLLCYEQFSILENNGWGRRFDGIKLFSILNN